jgi:hypothetical protein
VGTRGQLATPSDSTVEGGPGLDFVLEGAPGSQLGHVDQLNDHVVYLVILVGLGGGVGSVQLSTSHINLLSFVPTLQPCRNLLRFLFCELRGNLVVLSGLVQGGDDGAGVQGQRRQLSASARGTPRTLLQPPTRLSRHS